MNRNVSRRTFLKQAGWGSIVLLAGPSCSRSLHKKKANIIFILADDLGYAELGCYGQKKIRTPHIDRLAAEGMRFTQHYSGSPVCAPSRCVFLTGKHTGHAYIRGNDELRERGDVWNDPALEGQRHLESGTVTIGSLLQEAGYTTGAVGKWGLGGPGTTGEPNRQGFDHYYGVLCQRVAHNYYPTHLWRNGEKELLPGNERFKAHQRLPEGKDPDDPASYAPYSGQTYAMDVMAEDALQFLRDNHATPFFLYLPFPVPHVALQVPEDSLAEYAEAFPETPYTGKKGYLPHKAPRAAYAAMITRMDREIGRIMKLLKELGQDKNTLVIFSSDNGPTYAGGADSTFFESAGPLRGLKGSVYEGGIRVPMVARWLGRIKPGGSSDHVSGFQDFLPTFAELAGIEAPGDIDGISMLPTFKGMENAQKKHAYLYWEHIGRLQAVRLGKWKGVRHRPGELLELFDLENDVAESNNLASVQPDIVKTIEEIMRDGRIPSRYFPLKGVDDQE